MPAEATAPRVAPDRTRRLRLIRTVALLVGVVVPSLILRELIEFRFGRGPVADLSAVAVPMAATAWLAPYASYRRRDALLWLVGPGLYFFAVIAWRVALLPYRDWSPRPEEKTRMRWSRDPEHAGTWLLTEPAGDTGHTSSR
ncbi:hypothetical protein PSH03_003321 [Micromonospora sp. PSH03]|uniref:hypothetical protein n=1 Tax=Micromonospora salmantinae TaxID=2911211 RepID=UPI001EE9217A|nr:hypothetical protein [Micromonospora salmantinae]MCG5458149.1 hypothetical protein [Micromonospora salmantinae]